MPLNVALARADEYDSSRLEATVGGLLDLCGPGPKPGDRVLVKPNLVSRANARLSCTSPRVVRAACVWVLDHGARPLVADSPAFGSARANARACGLDKRLAGLDAAITGLGEPQGLALSFGGRIGVSRLALEADLILNAPKLKAHGQMRMSAAVKNLFGCVTGFRKALAHVRLGGRPRDFAGLIIEVMIALPRTISLLDGVEAMSDSGPIRGRACGLGLLAASESAVALDSAVYSMLGLEPGQVPLWQECLRRGLAGSEPSDLTFAPLSPAGFDCSAFRAPAELSPIRFAPLRFLRGRLKCLTHRLG
ncbi:MAG: DUF362 domain-containing protein [Desulfovibrionaceae bacterium]|nr:DUF362 domain-containing protein [Desulfovibrionaceae bacterium]